MFINFAKQQTELLDDEMEAAKVGSSGAGAAKYDKYAVTFSGGKKHKSFITFCFS